MTAITFDNRVAFSYQLRLPSFEGPLDVLLKLIERQHLPITDISLVMVSDQFLEAARNLGGANPHSVAEFASVGARLVLLKARSLLPRPDIDNDDEPSELVVQLIEYRAIKQAATDFGDLDQSGKVAFAKGSLAIILPDKPVELPLARHEPRQLSRAIGRRLITNRTVTRLVAVQPVIPLRVFVERLAGCIGRSRVQFQQVMQEHCADEHEQRSMFLALLLLVRRNVVVAAQSEPFGPILIQQVGEAPLTIAEESWEMEAHDRRGFE